METFGRYVQEMVNRGVQPIMERYGYAYTTGSDLALVTGWMEILVILFKVVPNVGTRQKIINHIFSHMVGSFLWLPLGLEVDKAAGTIKAGGEEYRFTPIFSLTSSDPKAQN